MADVAVTNVSGQASCGSGGISGETVPVSVTVANQGTGDATTDVTAYYNATAIDTLPVTALPPGSSIILNFAWDTTGVATGAYTLSATAAPLPGEVDLADNTRNDGTLYIATPRPAVDADINGDRQIDFDDLVMVVTMSGVSVVPGQFSLTGHADVDNDLDIDNIDVTYECEVQFTLPIIPDPDSDGDGAVSLDDLINVFVNQFLPVCPYGATPTYRHHMDVDRDCDVDVNDLIRVYLSQFTTFP